MVRYVNVLQLWPSTADRGGRGIRERVALIQVAVELRGPADAPLLFIYRVDGAQ